MPVKTTPNHRQCHRRRSQTAALSAARPATPADCVLPASPPRAVDRRVWSAAAAALTLVLAWAYWPTWSELVRAWEREPDYSHGYVVVPVALLLAWARRERFPGLARGLGWGGLGLILLSVVVRYVGARLYLGVFDAWSLLLWLAGVVWLFCGWRVLWWSWPAIAFLLFMIPLPYRVEHLLSYPLQRIAAELSCWTLQCLGQPALAEGNTLLINDLQLEVEQACSGLRIFVGIVALAFVYLILVRRPWWAKVVLLAGVVPVALVANASRIVATGLLLPHVRGESGQQWIHDASGWLMIPLAAALFALVLWYLDKLFREVRPFDVAEAIGSRADRAAAPAK